MTHYGCLLWYFNIIERSTAAAYLVAILQPNMWPDEVQFGLAGSTMWAITPCDDSNCNLMTTVRAIAEIEAMPNGDEVKMRFFEDPSIVAEPEFGDIDGWFNSNDAS